MTTAEDLATVQRILTRARASYLDDRSLFDAVTAATRDVAPRGYRTYLRNLALSYCPGEDKYAAIRAGVANSDFDFLAATGPRPK